MKIPFVNKGKYAKEKKFGFDICDNIGNLCWVSCWL